MGKGNNGGYFNKTGKRKKGGMKENVATNNAPDFTSEEKKKLKNKKGKNYK